MKFLRSNGNRVLLSRTFNAPRETISIKGRPWFRYGGTGDPDKAVEIAVKARYRGHGSARAVRDGTGWYTIYVRQTKIPTMPNVRRS